MTEDVTKSPNPDQTVTDVGKDSEEDTTNSTNISPVTTEPAETASNTDTIKEQQEESEKRIKELEEKLEQATTTIEQLQKEVSTYKSQLEQFSEEGPGPQVKSIPSEVTSPVSESPEEVSKLTLQIESLKVENNFLSDKVYTLEARVANLLSTNKKNAIDFARDTSDFDSDIASLSSPVLETRGDAARYNAGQQPRVASFAEMDLYGDVSKIRNINQEMDRWKGWQVDMRGWRTLGVGPVFAI